MAAETESLPRVWSRLFRAFSGLGTATAAAMAESAVGALSPATRVTVIRRAGEVAEASRRLAACARQAGE